MPQTGKGRGIYSLFFLLFSFILPAFFAFQTNLRTAYAADKDIEFGVADDLTVQGEEGSINDADVEIEGNTTTQRQVHINTEGLSTPFGGIGVGENLLTHSEALDDSAWTKTNITASPETDTSVYAPDGQDGTAEVLTNSGASNGYVSQIVSSGIGASTEYVFSVWLRAGTASSAQIKIEDDDSQSNTYTITSLPAKWKRYEVSFTTGASATQITVSIINTGADTETIYAWGAQLEQASHARVYVMTDASPVSEITGGSINGDLRLGSGMFNNPSSSSDLYISGNLEVDGTIYGTIGSSSDISGTSSQTFTVDTDNSGTGPADGAGYIIEGGSGTDVNFTYDATNDRMQLNYPILITDTDSNTLMSISDAGTTGDVTVTGNLTVSGNSTLGDASGDSVTINASTMSVPNNLNIDSDTLYIDASNDRVGVGTTSPSAKLSVYYGNLLFSQESAPTDPPDVSVNTESGVLNGVYRYVVTFVTSGGETEPSPISNSVAPVNQKVDLTNIPLGSGRVIARKIYRTVANDNWPYKFKLLTTINDNTTTSYTDNISDASLGDYAPIINTTGGSIYLNTSSVLEVNSVVTILAYGSGVNDSGLYNTFIGPYSGSSNTTGGHNTAVGYQALYSNTTGYDNVSIGDVALTSNTSGYHNTAIGRASLNRNTTGSSNTCAGFASCYSMTSGWNNTAIGLQSLYACTTGHDNVAIGLNAGRYLSNGITPNETGSGSVFIGSNTRALSVGNVNQIVIGYNAIGAGSNSVVLGNSLITKTVLRPKVGIGNESPQVGVDVSDGNGSIDYVSNNNDVYIQGNLEVDGTIYGTVANLDTDNIHDSDNDTKVQVEESSDEDYIRFDTAGTERMYIDNSGNVNVDSNTLYVDASNDRVGVGTTTPQNKLDVEGAAAIGASYSGTSTAPSNGLIVEGNVGIGTNSPNAKLEILSTSQQLRIGYDGANYWTDTIASDGGRSIVGNGTDADIDIDLTSATDGDFSVNTDDLFVDSSASKVGIGTNSPSETVTIKPKKFDSVQYYNGSSYTDDSTEAASVGGAAYTVLNGTSDYFYIGRSNSKFDTIYFDLAQAGSGVSISAEYYNGTSWTSFSITDGTNNLSQDGAITFTKPSDWSTTTVNGTTAYWVRLSTSAAATTAPTAYLTVPTSADRLSIYAQANDSSPALKIDKTGNVVISGEGTLELQGNARHTRMVRLCPEYPNVVFSADGTNNSGTLSSGMDTQNNYFYSYYQWSTSQTTLQDYDLYVRWQVPMDFDGFPSGTNDALIVDIATATTTATDNAVDVTLYKDGTATSSSDTDNVSTTAGTWMTDQEGTAVVKFDDSDTVLSSLSAGDVLVIKITLKANDTNSGWAKAGAIRIKYLSKW